LALAFTSTIINAGHIFLYFDYYGYLPSPFIHDKGDTFMDFFNPLFWAFQPGTYTEWQSVYPPLNFLILKIYKEFLFLNWKGYLNPFELRTLLENDIKYVVFSYIFILIITVEIIFKDIAGLYFRALISITTLFSSYFLFGLERGNLIFFSLLILAIYIYSKTELVKVITFAILINLKPYFLIIYLVRLIDYRNVADNKHFLFLAPLFSIFIFILTGLILELEFYLVPFNILGFATQKGLLSPMEVLTLPTSITAISYLVKLITEFKIPSIISLLVKFSVFIFLYKLLKLVYEKQCTPNDLIIIAIIFITNYSVNSGPYALLLYLPIIGLLFRMQEFRILVLVVIMLFGGVLDLIPVYAFQGHYMEVYLSGQFVQTEPFLTFGTLIRPIINFIVLILYLQKLKRYESKIKISLISPFRKYLNALFS